MHVACPRCNAALEVPDHLAGQVARCGLCSTLFTVPHAVPASGEPGAMGQPAAGPVEQPAGPPGPETRPAAPPGYPPPIPEAPPPRGAAATFGEVPSAVRVAAPGLGGGLAQAGPYPPAPSAAPGYMVYMPVDEARVHTRVGVAGGLMLTLGILTLLWACLMVLYIFMLQAGMLDETVDPDIPREMVGAVFVVLGVLSAVSGGIELAAGIQLIRKRLAARTLGMAAAILGLCSLWTCCVWLFALGFGIYALAVLGPNRPA